MCRALSESCVSATSSLTFQLDLEKGTANTPSLQKGDSQPEIKKLLHVLQPGTPGFMLSTATELLR